MHSQYSRFGRPTQRGPLPVPSKREPLTSVNAQTPHSSGRDRKPKAITFVAGRRGPFRRGWGILALTDRSPPCPHGPKPDGLRRASIGQSADYCKVGWGCSLQRYSMGPQCSGRRKEASWQGLSSGDVPGEKGGRSREQWTLMEPGPPKSPIRAYEFWPVQETGAGSYRKQRSSQRYSHQNLPPFLPVAIGRALQPFPRPKPSRRLSSHSAFQRGT
jgi:hypothetical protein